MNADLHHLQTQRVLRAAQARLDDLAEPEPDEDTITPDEALEFARHDIAATPYCAAHWLFEACGDATFPLDTQRLREILRDGERDLLVPELLAVLMCGCDSDALRARHALRERFDADLMRVAQADARRILAEQEREIQRNATEAA